MNTQIKELTAIAHASVGFHFLAQHAVKIMPDLKGICTEKKAREKMNEIAKMITDYMQKNPSCQTRVEAVNELTKTANLQLQVLLVAALSKRDIAIFKRWSKTQES